MTPVMAVSRKSCLLGVLIIALTIASGTSFGESNLDNLKEMNPGQLFAKADSLAADGKNEPAMEVLRTLVNRYPKHPLAENAKKMMVVIANKVVIEKNMRNEQAREDAQNRQDKEDEVKKLALQKQMVERKESEEDQNRAREYELRKKNREEQERRSAEADARQKAREKANSEEVTSAWVEGFKSLAGAVVERNNQRAEQAQQRRQQALIAQQEEQQRQAQIAQQQKAENDLMAEKRAQFDRQQAEHSALANQQAENKKATTAAAKQFADQSDADRQRRFAQEAINMAKGRQVSSQSQQIASNGEIPRDTRSGNDSTRSGGSVSIDWDVTDRKKQAHDIAEAARLKEIQNRELLRRQTESFNQNAAAEREKWAHDMREMRQRDTEETNAKNRTINAEGSNPNIIKIDFECSAGMSMNMTNLATTAALQGTVSYHSTGTSYTNEEDTWEYQGEQTYILLPGEHRIYSASAKSTDCKKAWSANVTNNHWQAFSPPN